MENDTAIFIIFISCIFTAIMVILAVDHYVVMPQENQNFLNQKTQIDSMTCKNLAIWLVNDLLNDLDSNGKKLFLYANQKYEVKDCQK